MVDVPYLLLDVFTQTQFEGNPLAVVIDPPPLTDGQMANIAREFNLSETIFLGGVGGGRWTTRIFTPAHELPFAGHPTVGGAIALALTGRAQPSPDLTAPTVVLVEGAGDVPVGIVPTDELAAGVPDAVADLLLAGLNRFFNSPLKRKHVARTARQALAIVARED